MLLHRCHTPYEQGFLIEFVKAVKPKARLAQNTPGTMEPLDNSLLKALAAQVEAIVASSSNTSAALRAAAATATNVAAMLEASARHLDADADADPDRDPDRERGAAVARVEQGEAARPSLLRELGPDHPLPLISQPNPTPNTPTQLIQPPLPQRPHRSPRSASRRRPSDK